MLYTPSIKHYLQSILCIFLFICPSAKAVVNITEVMPCNFSTLLNTDNYNFSGYVEFYNSDADTLNLKGFTIEHYKVGKEGFEKKWEWTIDTDFFIPGNAYSLLWADESKHTNHAPYKLDTDGGRIFLRLGDIPVDEIYYGSMVPGISYGRYAGTFGYMEPTPYTDNVVAHADLNRTKAPVFSEKGGIKTEGFLLELTCADEGSAIFYTTDGSDPYIGCNLYTAPIYIDSTQNIRAIAVAEGKLTSKTTTHSYIYPDEKHDNCGGFSIPIVNLAVNEAYFYDKMIGISVAGENGTRGEKSCTRPEANYNQDWKRPVSFQYIVDGEQVFSQDVEVAVEGGCSRSETIKSLSLKASKKSGAKEMPYHFFQSRPNTYHQTLHLRNGGTAYNDVKFRDGLMQTFATGMNIDFQAFQPVAYYINGKYKGLMSLNERTNADYIKTHYGLDEDEIDLVTVSDQLGIRASKGDLVAYNELVSFLTKNDPKDPNYFKEACKRMDMDEYIDYQVFEQFIVNTDWPGNNTKIWRERKEGSRFRWILFDTDFGFGLSAYTYLGNQTKNMIAWCLGKAPTNWGNSKSWMTQIFSNLSYNPEFKSKFVTKNLIHLSTTFSDEHINAVFDSIVPMVEAEYCADKKRSAETDTKKMRTFALARAPYVITHLKSYIGATGSANLVVKANVEGAMFTINGEKVNGFSGVYLTGFNTEIKAYPPVGYQFAGWLIDEEVFNTKSISNVSNNNLPGVLEGTLLSDGDITAVFVPELIAPTTLAINEICASSTAEGGVADEYLTFPDWIEVFNFGTEPIDLAGMALSTSKADLKMSVLPYGSDKTIVAPNGHLILWAKGDATDGPLYLSFKLNVDKRKDIYLSDANGNIVSQAYYDTHKANESYGWEKDIIGGNWMVFEKCEKWGYTMTPGNINVSTCDYDDPIENTEESIVSIYPNPTNSIATISCEEDIDLIELYDVKGRKLITLTDAATSASIDMSNFSTGLHIVKVYCNNNVYIQKLVKN